MKAVKKDIFDINKVTVVGSPTITSDGVASGFSGADYLTVNTTGFFNNNYNFEIDSKVKYTLNTTTEQELWDFSWIFRCKIATDNNKHRLDFFMPYGASYTNTFAYLEDYGFVDGDDLYIKCISENASSRKLMFSKDGINWNTITNTNTTDKDITSSNLLKIGQYNSSTYWLTNIDLTAFKIYVDGELVYSPTRPITFLERRKEGFDLSKFTVVGSPTITEDGVASGFSSSNLIYKDVDLDNKSFVIETPVFHYSQTSSADQYMISIGTYNNKLLIQTRVLASGKISIGMRNDTTDLVADVNTNAVLGNKYQIKFVLNTSVAEIYLKTNDGDYVLVKSATNTNLYTLNNNRLYIGNAYVGASQSFLGSIDLKQFSITVDGKEVFTGAKEKFYAIGD